MYTQIHAFNRTLTHLYRYTLYMVTFIDLNLRFVELIIFYPRNVIETHQLNAIETYRRYYKTKTWEMKWKEMPKWY